MSIPVAELKRHHVLDLKDGRFDGTTPADLVAMFRRIKEDPNGRNLVLHFHGGLVSRKRALAAATDLYETYRDGKAYPVFVVWNSDLVSTILGNLDEIAKEQAFKRLLFKLAQFLVGKIGERAGARGRLQLPSRHAVPTDPRRIATYLEAREDDGFSNLTLTKGQASQLETELRQDRPLRMATAEIMAAYRSKGDRDADESAHRRSRGVSPKRTSTKSLLSRKVLTRIEREAPRAGARGGALLVSLAGYGVKVARAVLRRYRAGRDHGLYTTVVEEILRELYLDNVGRLAWNMMKKDTADAFGGDPSTHGGTALIEQVRALGRRGQRVTVVGHSTGAIFIGHFLEHADRVLPKTRRFDVVHMAPACTFSFVHDRLPIYERRVASLRSFGLHDDLEHGYWEAPVLYNASLLYLVSGVLEDAGADTPLIGMERYFDASVYTGAEVEAVSRFMQDRLWSVVDAGDGRRSAARRHGGFDREKKTKESQSWLLANGM